MFVGDTSSIRGKCRHSPAAFPYWCILVGSRRPAANTCRHQSIGALQPERPPQLWPIFLASGELKSFERQQQSSSAPRPEGQLIAPRQLAAHTLKAASNSNAARPAGGSAAGGRRRASWAGSTTCQAACPAGKARRAHLRGILQRPEQAGLCGGSWRFARRRPARPARAPPPLAVGRHAGSWRAVQASSRQCHKV